MVLGLFIPGYELVEIVRKTPHLIGLRAYSPVSLSPFYFSKKISARGPFKITAMLQTGSLMIIGKAFLPLPL